VTNEERAAWELRIFTRVAKCDAETQRVLEAAIDLEAAMLVGDTAREEHDELFDAVRVWKANA
jgi:hypothetical protein